MIELPPKIDKKTLVNALVKGIDSNIMPIVDKVNDDYEYWDKVKYKKLPEGVTPQMLWANVKASRLRSMILVWEKYGVNLCITNKMQYMCHEFDMKFGSFWEVEGETQPVEKKYYRWDQIRLVKRNRHFINPKQLMHVCNDLCLFGPYGGVRCGECKTGKIRKELI